MTETTDTTETAPARVNAATQALLYARESIVGNLAECVRMRDEAQAKVEHQAGLIDNLELELAELDQALGTLG